MPAYHRSSYDGRACTRPRDRRRRPLATCVLLVTKLPTPRKLKTAVQSYRTVKKHTHKSLNSLTIMIHTRYSSFPKVINDLTSLVCTVTQLNDPLSFSLKHPNLTGDLGVGDLSPYRGLIDEWTWRHQILRRTKYVLSSIAVQHARGASLSCHERSENQVVLTTY